MGRGLPSSLLPSDARPLLPAASDGGSSSATELRRDPVRDEAQRTGRETARARVGEKGRERPYRPLEAQNGLGPGRLRGAMFAGSPKQKTQKRCFKKQQLLSLGRSR